MTATLIEDDTWRKFAACASDLDPDRWVDLPPVRVHGRNNPDYDLHKEQLAAMCADCPVRPACQAYANQTGVCGVFAGEDEYDRAEAREHNQLPLLPNEDTPQFTALRLARRGLSNTQIAHALNVSTMTVSRFTREDTAA